MIVLNWRKIIAKYNIAMSEDIENRNSDRLLLGFYANQNQLRENPTHQLDGLNPVLDFMF